MEITLEHKHDRNVVSQEMFDQFKLYMVNTYAQILIPSRLDEILQLGEKKKVFIDDTMCMACDVSFPIYMNCLKDNNRITGSCDTEISQILIQSHFAALQAIING